MWVFAFRFLVGRAKVFFQLDFFLFFCCLPLQTFLNDLLKGSDGRNANCTPSEHSVLTVSVAVRGMFHFHTIFGVILVSRANAADSCLLSYFDNGD